MKTVKLTNGDVSIEDGRTTWLTGRECLAQRLINAIKLDKGSWFLGPDKGIDWFSIYEKKTLSEKLVRSNIERVLQVDTEVKAIKSINLDFDNKARKITVAFTVDSIYGTVEGSV